MRKQEAPTTFRNTNMRKVLYRRDHRYMEIKVPALYEEQTLALALLYSSSPFSLRLIASKTSPISAMKSSSYENQLSSREEEHGGMT